MARLPDAHGTEVHRDDVERRVGGPLEHAAEAARETVGTERLHRIDHHAAGAATAERFHERGGECRDNIVSDAETSENPGDSVHEQVHRTAGAEYRDADEDGDQVRNHHDGRMEAFLGAFDERFVGLDLLVDG